MRSDAPYSTFHSFSLDSPTVRLCATKVTTMEATCHEDGTWIRNQDKHPFIRSVERMGSDARWNVHVTNPRTQIKNDAVLGKHTRAWEVFQVQKVGWHCPPDAQDDDVPFVHRCVLCQPTSLHPDRMVRAHKCFFGGLSWRVRLPWLVLRPGTPGVPEVVPNCTWPCCECSRRLQDVSAWT